LVRGQHLLEQQLYGRGLEVAAGRLALRPLGKLGLAAPSRGGAGRGRSRGGSGGGGGRSGGGQCGGRSGGGGRRSGGPSS
jgi:hypothetical protein